MKDTAKIIIITNQLKLIGKKKKTKGKSVKAVKGSKQAQLKIA